MPVDFHSSGVLPCLSVSLEAKGLIRAMLPLSLELAIRCSIEGRKCIFVFPLDHQLSSSAFLSVSKPLHIKRAQPG